MRGSSTSPGRRARAVTIATVVAALVGGLLVSGAGPAVAAPVCDTETFQRPTLGTYVVEVCLVTPEADTQLVDPVDVTATATVNDPAGRAQVQRVTFRWLPTGAASDTYLLSDNDAEPGNLYRMSLRSYRLPGATGTLVARAVVDDDVLDTAPADTRVDATADVTKDDETVPPTPAPFSPRLGAPAAGERYTMAATGDGVDGSPQSHAVVSVIEGWEPDSFAYLGDVYTEGTAYEFDTWYGEAGGYGDVQAITNPVIGNHEYRTDGGAPYFEFWGGVPHHYSYDVGGWHVVALDTNTEFAQTAVGSPQYQWLDADLAAHQDDCTMVLQHQPRYAEAPGSRGYLQDLWSLAYSRGVTLLLTGHVHKYERWTPMDAAGNPVAGGMTQIVAGGGGREPVNPPTAPDPRVAARGGVGALRLELGPDDFAFRYADANGGTVDEGVVPCRQRVAGAIPPPPVTSTPTTPSTPTSPSAPAISAPVASPTPSASPTPRPTRSTRRLLADLRTAPEHRAGWTSRRFPGWTDADHDGCSTPREVFLAEAVIEPRVRAGCDLRGGRWRSRYDGAVRTSDSRLTADHLVGLREAWASGAYRWSRLTRRQHGNDLGYPSSLIAVTTSSAAAKGGREPQDWLPRKAFRCSYLSQWVAVKWRWRLAVDGAERKFLRSRLASCGWPSVRLPTRPPITR